MISTTARSTVVSSAHLLSGAHAVLDLSNRLSDSLLAVSDNAAQACGSNAPNGEVTMTASACYALGLDLGLVREAVASCTNSLLTLSTILKTATNGMYGVYSRGGEVEILGHGAVSHANGYLNAIIVSEKEYLRDVGDLDTVARKLHTHRAIFSHLL